LAITGFDMREGVGFGHKHAVLLLREQQRILNTAKHRVAVVTSFVLAQN